MNIDKYLEMTDEELLSLPMNEKLKYIKELLELMNNTIEENKYAPLKINKFLEYFGKSRVLTLSDKEIEENDKLFLKVIKIAKTHLELNYKNPKELNTDINECLKSLDHFKSLQDIEIIYLLEANNYLIKEKLNKSDLSLLKDIKTYLIYFNNSDPSKRNQYIVTLYKILKKTLPSQKELFLDYITKNNISTLTNDMLFSNISNINYDEDIMQLWYLKQYINNPNELKEYVLIAGNKYPDNTLKLIIKLNGKMKKTLNAITPKLEYFLSYIETNPLSTKNNVNLSTTGYKGKKDVKTYDWFKNNVNNNPYIFLELVKEYKDKYPNAYKKIEEFITRYFNDDLSDEKKFEICLQQLNDCDNIKMLKQKRFSDYYPNIKQDSRLLSWIYKTKASTMDELLKTRNDLQVTYPKGYRLVQESTINREQEKIDYLDFDQKLEIYLQYIEEHNFPTYSDKIRFSDIEPNKNNTTLYCWSYYQLYNEDAIKYAKDKYKDKYPKAISKVIEKYNELLNTREILTKRITKEDKVQIFMEYINTNPIPTITNEIRFCDISNNQDETAISCWLRDTIAKRKETLISICDSYKDIYPQAYEKICIKLKKNESLKRKKQEKKLLQVLKNILESKQNSYTSKKKVL